MLHVKDGEVELALQNTVRKQFINAHGKAFPEFYKDSALSGVKRAEYIWWKRNEMAARIEEKKHTIVLKTKAITTPRACDCRKDDLPDIAVIMTDILNELRINTKQMDELLALARPKDKKVA